MKNAHSSSGEWKRAVRPETICSTRPVKRGRAALVSSRNCTTKAREGDRGGSGSRVRGAESGGRRGFVFTNWSFPWSFDHVVILESAAVEYD